MCFRTLLEGGCLRLILAAMDGYTEVFNVF